MQSYRLSKDAKQDLKEVTRYTLNKWGKNALKKYVSDLTKTFEAIGDGIVPKQAFSRRFPKLFVTKCRYHYVFYVSVGMDRPGIIGVIHERRDIFSRLSKRLGGPPTTK